MEQMLKQIRRTIKIGYFLWEEYDSGGRVFHLTTAWRCSRLLSIGTNNYRKTHPEMLKYNYTNRDGKIYTPGRHSEWACLSQIGQQDCSKIIFINIRIDRNGKIAYSKPCNGCRKLLDNSGYKMILYSTNEGAFEKL